MRLHRDQHLRHLRGQVVVADVPPRHPASGLERDRVPFQEGLLRLAGIHARQSLPEHDSMVDEQAARAGAPASSTSMSPKSTSAPGSLACGTNLARVPGAGPVLRGDLSARRVYTYLARAVRVQVGVVGMAGGCDAGIPGRLGDPRWRGSAGLP